MKQIGLALHNYHATYDGFPEAHWTPTTGVNHSWATLILPYIEQDNLYRQYNLGYNWSNPVNDSGVIQTVVKQYVCPAAPTPRRGRPPTPAESSTTRRSASWSGPTPTR